MAGGFSLNGVIRSVCSTFFGSLNVDDLTDEAGDALIFLHDYGYKFVLNTSRESDLIKHNHLSSHSQHSSGVAYPFSQIDQQP